MISSADLCASRPRTAKHLTERKRRARINDSLLQLKSMVFPAVKKEISSHPKMEKADILEMTVRYLKELQTQSSEGSRPLSAGVGQYHAGFTECLSEVSSFMSSCESIDLDTRLRLLNHLADRCSTMNEPEQKPQVQSQPSQQQPEQQVPQQVAFPSPAAATVVSQTSVPVMQQPSRVPPTTQGSMVILVPAHAVQAVPTSPIISVSVPSNDQLLTPPQSPVSLSSPGATRLTLTPSPVAVVPPRQCPPKQTSTDIHSHRYSPYQKHQSFPSQTAAKQMWRPW
uniref:Hairy and enhancer of split transcription factor C n=1 Tax=Prionocidaris baculosa TaxID=1198993 RepID=A0A090BCI6_9ECHN|nr:hairy and enhancer of split transcription factor C [Prionocidaris baculosa]